MTTLWVVWSTAAVVMLVVGGVAGTSVKGTPLGLLIDERERYSLNRFQLLWWLWIILSMVAGVAAARFTVLDGRPLGFSIPGPVLALLGTVGGTTIVASTVKSHRDKTARTSVAASLPGGAFLGQLLLQEEGSGADQTLDVGKFQALVITVLLGAGYVLTAVYAFIGRDVPRITSPNQITTLPALDPTLVALLGISAGSYVGTKLVTRSGTPPLSLADRDRHTRDVLAQARADGSVVDGRRLRELLRPSDPDETLPADAPKAPSPLVGGIRLDADAPHPGAPARGQDAPVAAGWGVPLDKPHQNGQRARS